MSEVRTHAKAQEWFRYMADKSLRIEVSYAAKHGPVKSRVGLTIVDGCAFGRLVEFMDGFILEYGWRSKGEGFEFFERLA